MLPFPSPIPPASVRAVTDRNMPVLASRHLLAIEGMHPPQIAELLDLAESYVLLNRSGKTQRDTLRGRTVINLFFEDSTRTRTSFELAGKRLGADVINMSVSSSSVNKGETLLDTAATLNAMHCDLLVVRHAQSGAPSLLAQKVGAAVVNAGDGTHEHPTQALLDALTIRRRSAATWRTAGWRGRTFICSARWVAGSGWWGRRRCCRRRSGAWEWTCSTTWRAGWTAWTW